RRFRSSAVAISLPLPSAVEEGEPVFADLQLVAVLELAGLDALAVHECPVEAALILDEEAAVAFDEDRMLAGDRDVVEEDAAVGRASDRGFTLGMKGLARPAAAGAHDERRTLDAEILQGPGGCVIPLLGGEALGRLGSPL